MFHLFDTYLNGCVLLSDQYLIYLYDLWLFFRREIYKKHDNNSENQFKVQITQEIQNMYSKFIEMIVSVEEESEHF